MMGQPELPIWKEKGTQSHFLNECVPFPLYRGNGHGKEQSR